MAKRHHLRSFARVLGMTGGLAGHVKRKRRRRHHGGKRRGGFGGVLGSVGRYLTHDSHIDPFMALKRKFARQQWSATEQEFLKKKLPDLERQAMQAAIDKLENDSQFRAVVDAAKHRETAELAGALAPLKDVLNMLR